jgi:hypothetical protein
VRRFAAVALACVAVGWVFGQMADRPIVLRMRTDVQKTVAQSRVTFQGLADQGHTGSGETVLRMRTAVGRLVHEYKTNAAEMVYQSRVSLGAQLMTVAEGTSFVIVHRRRFEEPLFGQHLVTVQRVVDQFPTGTDFTK